MGIVETNVFRLKQITGGRLTARTFGAQKVEAKIAVAVANTVIRAAKPILVRASSTDQARRTTPLRARCTTVESCPFAISATLAA
ncbi:MAG: hypothetical protein AAFS03_10755 [Pseudomonadota bacterium]